MSAPAHPRVADVARLLVEAGAPGEVRMPARHERAWAAAGHLAAVFPTSDELLRLTRSTPAVVGTGRGGALDTAASDVRPASEAQVCTS